MLADVNPDNIYIADSMHRGFSAMVDAARLLGEQIDDIADYEAKFWVAILSLTQAAGNA